MHSKHNIVKIYDSSIVPLNLGNVIEDIFARELGQAFTNDLLKLNHARFGGREVSLRCQDLRHPICQNPFRRRFYLAPRKLYWIEHWRIWAQTQQNVAGEFMLSEHLLNSRVARGIV